MSSNRETYAAVCQLGRTVEALRVALFDGVLQRMAEAEGGLAAARFDAVRASGSHADATSGWAQRGTGLATVHLADLGNSLRVAQNAVEGAVSIARLYPPPRPADDDDRAALARLNGREPSCSSCSRLRREDGQPRWEPIDCRLSEATTVAGRLAEPMLLCVWCVERVRAWSRLPTVAELERHHRGERVPWPADVERSA